MKSIILIICLLILSIISITIADSKAHWIDAIFTLLILVSIVGILSGLVLTLWLDGNFKTKLKKALMISLPLTLIFYLAGFSFLLIETMIRQ